MLLRPSSITQITKFNPQILVYDEFADPNGTLITAHTPNIAPVGSAWLAPSGFVSTPTVTPTISSNQLAVPATTGNGCVINTTQKNVVITITDTGTGLRRYCILIRFQSNGNCYSLTFYQDLNSIIFERWIAGATTTLKTTPFTFVTGADIFSVRIFDDNIFASVNGIPAFFFYGMTLYLTSTVFGFCGRSNSATIWDNLTITKA